MFNPRDFTVFPSMVVVSDAAARELVKKAIVMRTESNRLFLAYCAVHVEDVTERLKAEESKLARLGGGVFLTDIPETDLTVLDSILPPTFTRVVALCTRAEAQEALMNIEDFSNHGGYQFVEIEPKS